MVCYRFRFLFELMEVFEIKLKNKIINGIKLLAFALMLAITISAASASVTAFRFLGFEVSKDGIHKVDPVQEAIEQAQEQARTQQPTEDIASARLRSARERRENKKEETEEKSQENQEQKRERARPRVDVVSAIHSANADNMTREALKDFAGDSFCVRTEERIAYIQVSEIGRVDLLSEKPKGCYEVKTSEEFISYAWNKTQSGQMLSVSEVKENVKMPLSLRMRFLMKSIFS